MPWSVHSTTPTKDSTYNKTRCPSGAWVCGQIKSFCLEQRATLLQLTLVCVSAERKNIFNPLSPKKLQELMGSQEG